jgi:hypothetical protein
VWVFFKSKFIAEKAIKNEVRDYIQKKQEENKVYKLLSGEEKELVDIKVFQEYI